MVANVNIPIHYKTHNIGKLVPIDTVKISIYRFHLTQQNFYIHETTGEIVPITSHQDRCTKSHQSLQREKYIFQYYPVGMPYKPSIIYVRHYPRHNCYELVVELSLPKLTYGNNIYELTEDLLDTSVLKLHHLLKECGVIVTRADIKDESAMLRIDIGKNIILKHSTVTNFVKPLKLLTKGYKYKPSQISYKTTNGFCIQWIGNQYTKFYDKILELKAHDPKSYLIFKSYERRILRFEHELSSKQTIGREYGLYRSISLREAFNSKVCQKVLMKNFNKLTGNGKYPLMLLDTARPEILYSHLLEDRKLSPYSHIKHDWIVLIFLLQSAGEVKAKELIAENFSKQTYYKYLRDWYAFSQHVSHQDPRFKDFEAVLESLDVFQPLQIGRL